MYYKIQSNYSDTLCMRKTLKTATHSPVVIVACEQALGSFWGKK